MFDLDSDPDLIYNWEFLVFIVYKKKNEPFFKFGFCQKPCSGWCGRRCYLFLSSESGTGAAFRKRPPQYLRSGNERELCLAPAHARVALQFAGSIVPPLPVFLNGALPDLTAVILVCYPSRQRQPGLSWALSCGFIGAPIVT